MKIEKNNVKIEITETKYDKICIDITTSKEIVVNVKKESSKIISPRKNIDLIEKKLGIADGIEGKELDGISDNEFFDLTDIEKRELKNNKE